LRRLRRVAVPKKFVVERGRKALLDLYGREAGRADFGHSFVLACHPGTAGLRLSGDRVAVAIRLMLTLNEIQPKIPQVDTNRAGHPSRLWSLWDMVKFKVRDLMHVVGFLDLVFSKEGLKDVPTYLPGLRTSCTQLKMAVSVRHIDDLLDAKNTSKDEAAYYHFLERECGNLADTVRRELDTKIVLAVPDEASIELFENEYPFDTEKIKVNDRLLLTIRSGPLRCSHLAHPPGFNHPCS